MNDAADPNLAKLRRIAKQRDRAAKEEPDAIAEALRAGLRVTDIAEAAGRTREHIRRVAIKHGIGERP